MSSAGVKPWRAAVAAGLLWSARAPLADLPPAEFEIRRDDVESVTITLAREDEIGVSLKLKPAPAETLLRFSESNLNRMVVFSLSGQPWLGPRTLDGKLSAGILRVCVPTFQDALSKLAECFPHYASTPIKEPIAFFPLDGDTRDRSGQANHATGKGLAFAADRFGRPGRSCRIGTEGSLILHARLFQGLRDCTLSAWICLDSLHNEAGPDSLNTLVAIVNDSCPSEPGDNELLFGYRAQHQCFAVDMGRRPIRLPNSLIDEENWYHVALRRQDGELSLFLDGQLVSSAPARPEPLAPAAGGVVVGQEQDAIGGGFDAAQSLDGRIDDLRIYNRALTEEEIRDLYNRESAPPKPGATAGGAGGP